MTTLSNFKKNILGTVSFDGKFDGMRKAQDFIVYPMQDSGMIISIQSEHRFGYINLENGAVEISANHAQYANSLKYQVDSIRGLTKQSTLCLEDLQNLKTWIKSTGGLEVGDSFVKCDNTGAIAI